MNKKFLIIVALFFISSFVFCEDLPLGYKNIRLGQSFEEVRSILEKDSSFGFRGDRDVSLLPTEERVLIETSGSSFFERCWFQFYGCWWYVNNFFCQKLQFISDVQIGKLKALGIFSAMNFCRGFGINAVILT